MKRFMLAAALILCVGLSFAQSVLGDWHGVLDIYGMKLRIVFHIAEHADSLAATFDSPDQGAFGIPVNRVSYANSVLKLESDAPPIVYIGTLQGEAIKGTFYQAGMELPLDLQRQEMDKPVYVRPQTPEEPYPYKVEEIEFHNRDAKVTLSATLTIPKGKGKHPAVILISGSGPQDRDEELMGHKPFWVIADYLSRNGIAVLRYDDRGVGKSQGNFDTATSEDFASDVKSAVKYLNKRKDISGIGLIGHSEGGLIAPMVAAQMPKLKFIVLLAGPGLRGDKLLLLQEEMIWRVDETDNAKIEKSLSINRNVFQMIIDEQKPEALGTRIDEYIDKGINSGDLDIPDGFSHEDVKKQFTDQMLNPWMLYFIRHDPAPILEKVRCPVLALNGAKDLQVPARENLDAIGAALKRGGNKKYELVEIAGLNHLFQEAETGHPNEYAQIEQTFSPKALEIMLKWINTQTHKKAN